MKWKPAGLQTAYLLLLSQKKKAARQDDDFAGTVWGEDEEAACAEEAPGGDFEAFSWEGVDVVEEAAR